VDLGSSRCLRSIRRIPFLRRSRCRDRDSRPRYSTTLSITRITESKIVPATIPAAVAPSIGSNKMSNAVLSMTLFPSVASVSFSSPRVQAPVEAPPEGLRRGLTHLRCQQRRGAHSGGFSAVFVISRFNSGEISPVVERRFCPSATDLLVGMQFCSSMTIVVLDTR
jgi:hypothetical protein